MSFGKLAPPAERRKDIGAVFGLAVMGDFSGRANRGELETGAALAARKPRRVDVDNLDDVLASLELKLSLPIGDDGAAVDVAIASMDDFHPDELYQKVEAFAHLSKLRQRLQNADSFEKAAAHVRGWGDTAPAQAQRLRPKPRGAAIPNAKLSDFARLMGATTATVEVTPAYELIKQIVRPYVQPAASPDQAELVATVDTALTAMMRRLLHHPDFQTLEGLWRTVDLLVRELETDEKLQIILYDITAEEVAADLASSEDLSQTGLYQLFVEQPALDLRTVPPSAIIGNYTFQQTPPHADLLGRMAKISAAAQAPFIAGIDTDAFDKKKPEDIHPLVAESWGTLRALPHAAYLGLAVPRFMLRWPYGAKTEPIEPFPFEEFTEHFGLKGFLWGHSANLVGIMLAKTFAEQGMGGMQLGSIMVQGDLPLYYYVDRDGDQMALPCTERLATESVAAYAASQGFMPVVWMRGRGEVRLTTLSGMNTAPLAGPWAPVEMPAETAPPAVAAAPAAEPAALQEQDGVDDEPAAAADSPAAVEPEVAEPPPAEPPPAAAPEDDSAGDDLDDLLSQLEDDAPAAEAAQDEVSSEDASDDDDDLDVLLASIEGDAEVDDEDAESDEMDPELAALLADL